MHVYPETLVFFIRKGKLHFMWAENQLTSLSKESSIGYYILTVKIFYGDPSFQSYVTVNRACGLKGIQTFTITTSD